MKKFLAASALVMGFWAGSAQAVTTVNFTAGGSTVATGTTVFQNFDALTSGSSIGPNAFVFGANLGNLAVRPAFGSTGNFAAVLDGGSYSANFGPSSTFSFVIGSLDTFNTLTLRYADGTSSIFNGGAIINDPSFDNGNRTSTETNGVVTYRVTSGALLTGVTFGSSGGNSFEFDNLAASAAAVPEPAAWGMMILGFGLVGGAMRRRPSVKVKFA
jgi:hypothetical protein